MELHLSMLMQSRDMDLVRVKARIKLAKKAFVLSSNKLRTVYLIFTLLIKELLRITEDLIYL